MSKIALALAIATSNAVAWRMGFTAGRNGERESLIGGGALVITFLLCAGFVLLCRKQWSMITGAPAGKSPASNVIMLLVGLLVFLYSTYRLGLLVLQSDSVSLGVVMSVSLVVMAYVLRDYRFHRPSFGRKTKTNVSIDNLFQSDDASH